MADQDSSQKNIIRRDRSDQPLFRPEAIAEQQTQWLGTVLLAPSLSHKFFALFAAIAAVLALIWALVGLFLGKRYEAADGEPRSGDELLSEA